MSVETLRTELFAMTEPAKASVLQALPEGDPQRPTPEALAEQHEVSVETVYETVEEVIDHPWPFISIVLRCGYVELIGDRDPDGRVNGQRFRGWHGRSIHRMRKTDAHTIVRLDRSPTWALLLVGRRRPEPSWGYWENSEWVPHDQHPHDAEFAAALAA
jgi:hypothetical protein